MRKLLLLLLAVLLCGCSVGAGANRKTQLVLRYADNQPEGYPTTVAAEYFAGLVEERTRGRIRIRVYADSVLGDEISTLEQLQFGGIDMARLSTGTLTGQNELLSMLTMPYLYEDADHMWRVLDGPIGERLLSSVRASGIVGMSWYDAGARSFYSVVPVTQLADLQGLRIRVQESDAMSQMVALLGAEPVPLAYDQVYSQLLIGKVDGAENNLPSFVSMGHSRVARYFLWDEHSRLPEMQVMSSAALDKIAAIDEDYVTIVANCARESALYERQLWMEQTEAYREEAERQGVTFTELDGESLHQFRRAVQPMYDALPEDGKLLIAQIRNS